MKMFKWHSISGAVLGLVLCVSSAAQASTIDYAFNFTGSAFTGSGDIVVNSAVDSLGGHDILGISGTIGGPTFGSITGLDTQPGTPNAIGLYTDPTTGKQWLYNDVLFTSGVPFNYYGVLFNFGNKYVGNIYSIGTQLYLSVSQPDTYFDPGDAIRLSMTVSQTPLPATALLFGSGLAGAALLRRLRKRKISISSPAVTG